MIGKEDIEKLAALARLEIPPGEAEALTHDIEAILSYVAQVKEEEGEVSAKAVPPLRNVMREDAEPHAAGAYTEEILAEAPNTEGKHISVKPILSRDA